MASKMIALLEKVKDMLGVVQVGPGTQKKASQSNGSSSSAAKAKLAALVSMSKKGQDGALKVAAHGSKKTK